MNIENLDELVTFSRYMNFSKAAAKLNLAQPTLSSHIASMERELGFELVRRKPSLELTPAGKRMCVNAKRIVEFYHETVDTCRSISKERTGSLHIQRPIDIGGLGQAFDEFILRFAILNPWIDVTANESMGTSDPEMLRSGVIDVAFQLTDIGDSIRLKYGEDASVIIAPFEFLGPYYLWVDSSSEFAQYDELEVGQANGARFLIPSDIRYQGLEDFASTTYDFLGVKVDVDFFPGTYEECVMNIASDEVIIVNEGEHKNKLYDTMPKRKFAKLIDFHKLYRPCFVYMKSNDNPAIESFKKFIQRI